MFKLIRAPRGRPSLFQTVWRSFWALSLVWCAPALSADGSVAAQQASSSGALRAVASPAFGSPIAYGASWGSFGAGAFAQTIREKGDPRDADGTIGFATGLGDGTERVGLEINAVITSLTNQSGDGFGEVGQAGAKLHTVLKGDWAVAIGAESLAAWGGLHGQSVSPYAVVTKIVGFRLGRPFTVVANLGGGQGRFGKFHLPDLQAESDSDSGADSAFKNHRFGPFGSLSLYVSPRLAFIGDSTVNVTNAAISFVPIRSWPLTIGLGALNLRKQFGAPIDYAVTFGYGFGWRTRGDGCLPVTPAPSGTGR